MPVPHLDVVADVGPEVAPRDHRERDAPQTEHEERESEDGRPASAGSDPGFQPVERVAQATRHLDVEATPRRRTCGTLLDPHGPPAYARLGAVASPERRERVGYGLVSDMPDLRLVPKPELDRLRAADVDPDARLALLADMCRLNALVAVKRAGSGHLGSTFSALDVVAHLLFDELNVAELGFDDPDRDVFFSSKGHDVPGLYAALFALGVVPRERLLRLRRLGGLDGHPDVGVPGIEANSGSLGMGISKARGIALAKRRLGRGGRVVVMTGDGELQEGQNWEALQAAAHERLGRLWVVVDRNELQSDKPTEEILALGDLEAKLRAFGWHVETADGHDHAALRAAFARFRDGRRRAEGARRADDQGQGRLVHGAPGRARRRRRHVPLARRRARRRAVRARGRRARGAPRRAVRRARPRAARARGRRARGAASAASRASPSRAPARRASRP